MNVLYHVLTSEEWGRAQERDPVVHRGPDGFIHCCRPEQLAGVLERYFAGAGPCKLLVLDVAKLEAEIRYERGVDCPGETFPHLYADLPRASVIAVADPE